jgi:hypothetical protein
LERKARPEDRERDQQTGNRRSEGHAQNGSEKRNGKYQNMNGQKTGNASMKIKPANIGV